MATVNIHSWCYRPIDYYAPNQSQPCYAFAYMNVQLKPPISSSEIKQGTRSITDTYSEQSSASVTSDARDTGQGVSLALCTVL